MPVSNAYVSWLATNNLLLQWFYYTTAAALMPSPYRSRTFASKLHTVTASILFPFSIVVVMLIWAQYIMDPGTQASSEVRSLFAVNWNHMAVLPVLAMLVDIFMWQHRRARLSRYGAYVGPALSSLVMVAGYEEIVVHYNIWTYPMFRKLHVGCRPILPIVCFYLAFVSVYPLYHRLRMFKFRF
uniref:Uncharacterized protein n=1 Tax=Globodera rostochiensis TaxID=31243 RepID=A0A914H5K5_GLORO